MIKHILSLIVLLSLNIVYAGGETGGSGIAREASLFVRGGSDGGGNIFKLNAIKYLAEDNEVVYFNINKSENIYMLKHNLIDKNPALESILKESFDSQNWVELK